MRFHSQSSFCLWFGLWSSTNRWFDWPHSTGWQTKNCVSFGYVRSPQKMNGAPKKTVLVVVSVSLRKSGRRYGGIFLCPLARSLVCNKAAQPRAHSTAAGLTVNSFTFLPAPLPIHSHNTLRQTRIILNREQPKTPVLEQQRHHKHHKHHKYHTGANNLE
jgi:hypothetical protein